MKLHYLLVFFLCGCDVNKPPKPLSLVDRYTPETDVYIIVNSIGEREIYPDSTKIFVQVCAGKFRIPFPFEELDHTNQILFKVDSSLIVRDIEDQYNEEEFIFSGRHCLNLFMNDDSLAHTVIFYYNYLPKKDESNFILFDNCRYEKK